MKVKVKVVLCRDAEDKDSLDASWRHPENVNLTVKSGATPDGVSGSTGSDGVATFELVKSKDGKYTVTLDEDQLNGYTHDTGRDGGLRLSIANDDEPAELRCYPAEDKRQLVVRALWAPDAGTPAVPLGNAVVYVFGHHGLGEPKRLETGRDGEAISLFSHQSLRIVADDRNLDDATVLMPVVRSFELPGTRTSDQVEIFYQRPATIRIRPTLRSPGRPPEEIDGLSVTLTNDPADSRPPLLATARSGCQFVVPAGSYVATPVLPHRSARGLVRPLQPDLRITVGAGTEVDHELPFEPQDAELVAVVVLPDGQQAPGVGLTVSGEDETVKTTTGPDGTYHRLVRPGERWTVSLPAAMTVRGKRYAVDGAAVRTVAVERGNSRTVRFDLVDDTSPKHGVRGRVVDRRGMPVPNAVVEAFDDHDRSLGIAVTDGDGSYELKLAGSGEVLLTLRRQQGRLERRQRVTVNSVAQAADLVADDLDDEPDGGFGGGRTRDPSGGRYDRGGNGFGSVDRGAESREALVDLAAYPVMTEPVTTGGGGPVGGGGRGGGGVGASAVDQVIRDVLGWRPRTADPAGFTAALAGAFELNVVEGHVESTWRPRGYAVQADLGAITGPQASIHARARNALEQILPLLDGLTALDPAADLDDTQAIRTVVRTELTELVGEFALQGGPRTQRVDDLFTQLVGFSPANGSLPEPASVGGQLGVLGDRFGLAPDRVNTLDEERMVTNFRIVVEYVLALAASWRTDRNLFAAGASSPFVGTVLIRLSRSLHVIAEAVDDLEFALDSVFVGAPDRQVLELPLQPPLLLSDLLEWIRQAVTVEGPALIQDAGKDGVVAFYSVLDRLRQLSHGTVRAITPGSRSGGGGALPPGMRTPRVQRAFAELTAQLDRAADLAGGVQRLPEPTIAGAITTSATTSTPVGHRGFGQSDDTDVTGPAEAGKIQVIVLGSNFREGARAELSAPGRPVVEAVAVDPSASHTALPASTLVLQSASAGIATFDSTVPDNFPGSIWYVAVVNSDGTRSNTVQVLPTTAGR